MEHLKLLVAALVLLSVSCVLVNAEGKILRVRSRRSHLEASF